MKGPVVSSKVSLTILPKIPQHIMSKLLMETTKNTNGLCSSGFPNGIGVGNEHGRVKYVSSLNINIHGSGYYK